MFWVISLGVGFLDDAIIHIVNLDFGNVLLFHTVYKFDQQMRVSVMLLPVNFYDES